MVGGWVWDLGAGEGNGLANVLDEEGARPDRHRARVLRRANRLAYQNGVD